MNYNFLDMLEAEAISIIRETFSAFSNPVILFSGGKDSIVLTHLAKKAFLPAHMPFALLHIDTGHNFPEILQYRDKLVKKLGCRLVVGSVQNAIDAGLVQEQVGKFPSRNAIQSTVLLQAIRDNKFDACIGGARRDEEKARAKERIFSLRDAFGGWTPKNQRPEINTLYNPKISIGENMRVFPLSNWTELDVWHYIARENIPVPPLYLAHERQCIIHEGLLFPVSEFIHIDPADTVQTHMVRFRTCGDITCTAAVPSNADTLDQVIAEITASNDDERAARLDDKTSDVAMEQRKAQGYF